MPIFCIDIGTFKEEKYVASESLDSNSSARLNLPTVPPCLTFLAILHHPVHFTCQREHENELKVLRLKEKKKTLNMIKQ